MIGTHAATVKVMPREAKEDKPEEYQKKERTMPHVIVKLRTGKSEEQKTRLAEAITHDVMRILNYGEESVSVALEEIEPQDWAKEVYKPDIVNNSEKLYKKPGYTM